MSLSPYITWLKTATANFSIIVKSEASSQRKGTVLELASSSAPAKVHSAMKMIKLLNIFLHLIIVYFFHLATVGFRVNFSVIISWIFIQTNCTGQGKDLKASAVSPYRQ